MKAGRSMVIPESNESNDAHARKDAAVLPQVRLFLRDVACFAGRRGVRAALLMAMGGLFEGLTLAMTVPLLAIVTGGGAPFGRLEHAAAALFDAAGVEARFGKLAVLLGIFGVLMIVRMAVVACEIAR
jgi:hypothetical protein